MIPRTLFAELISSQQNPGVKPLLLYGARGTGKTTVIENLQKKHETCLYFNLEEKSDRSIFNLHYPVDDQLDFIFLSRDKNMDHTNSCICLDEIQALPDFHLHLKRLIPVSPKLRWILTSSKLDQSITRLIDDPDQMVEAHPVHPCSFHDFLMAINDPDALESYQEIPFPGYRHDKLLHYFHLYILIGGMPAILKQYTETKSLSGLKSIYNQILDAQLRDIDSEKTSSSRRKMCSFVLQTCFPYASTRIKFKGFGNSPYRSREMGDVFRLLETHMLCKLIYPITETSPTAVCRKNKLPRLHLLDTGMVNYFSGIQKPLIQSADMNRIFHGQIARQVVGQELIASETLRGNGLHFWVREKAQSGAEVDFLLSYHDLFIPVTVRSGEPGRLRSLHQFMDAAPHPFAVRLYAGRLSIQQAQTLKGTKFYLLSLPYFLAGKIKEHLQGFIKFVSF